MRESRTKGGELMLWFLFKVLFVLMVINGILDVLLHGASSLLNICNTVINSSNSSSSSNITSIASGGIATKFMPLIHYKRGKEGNSEYLRKICPQDSAAAKDRLEILDDFVYLDDQYFLLRDDDGNLYLRQYKHMHNTPDTIKRYILSNVQDKEITRFKKENSDFSCICREKLGRSAQELTISYKDHCSVNLLINTYKVWYLTANADPLETAYKMETSNMDYVYTGNGAGGKPFSDNLDLELDDSDVFKTIDLGPDFDRSAGGSFSTTFGGHSSVSAFDDNNPNKWGSDAWWEEQERFINDSLYVNHDWDIFRREEANCKNENCHDPWHHHKK